MSARVLVVWCPDWPLVTVGAGPEAPAVVVAGGRVVACTAAARNVGVRRGQRQRDAQRRCVNLAVYRDDLAEQARRFEQVVGIVEEMCPRLEVVRPGLLALPVRGPSRYYGGERTVGDQLRETVAAAGFDCAVGVADGSFAASLAARVPPTGVVVPTGETAEFLAGHHVTVLDRPELASLLVRLGIRTLGEFAALPAHDVLSRFGDDGATAHRLARGVAARPPATRPPGENLAAERRFDPPLDAEAVVFAARSVADELHDSLRSRGLSCVQVEVEVVTEDGRSRSRVWRHDGLLSSLAVAERVRWQVDAWRTADPGSPEELSCGVSLLRLVPHDLVTAGGHQFALWGQSTVTDPVDRAATRVQTMLGQAEVARPALGGGRGPGERVVRVPWGDRLESSLPADRPWPGQVPSPAPSVVCPEPLPVRVVDADGYPVTVSGRCVPSAPPAAVQVDNAVLRVTGWAGPWPVVEHWWDSSVARRLARFQVVTEEGHALLLLMEQGHWLVEARYD